MSFQNTLSLLLNFALLSLVAAEETLTTSSHGDAWKFGTGGGVVGFIVLILDIMVWIEVLKSNRPALPKLLWCVGVFIFPIGGLIIYWLFSDRAAHNTSGGYESIA